MVVGTEANPPLRMEFVSNLSDVKPGDNIVASGVDGIYPKGYLIGRVELTDRGSGLYRTITVRPGVDFSSLEEVLVVMVPSTGARAEDAEVKTAVVLIAIAVALVLQTTLSGLMVGGTMAVNLVLVALVYLALAYGPVTGMLGGTIGGLTQDALVGRHRRHRRDDEHDHRLRGRRPRRAVQPVVDGAAAGDVRGRDLRARDHVRRAARADRRGGRSGCSGRRR